jgi:Domain of unknown function (DUF4396)
LEGSLNRIALVATLHCLTGCAIGEVLGMVIGTALGWGDVATIALAILLAFCFGYSFTMFPLLRSGISLRRALGTAFAADSVSISIMEIVDNLFIVIVPGALAAGLDDGLFWWSLGIGLFLAFWAAFPVNRWMIARGRGCAHAHGHGHVHDHAHAHAHAE